jgi:hypothetical protein
VCPGGANLLARDIEDDVLKPAAQFFTRIVSIPNPTRGETLVGIELAAERRIGVADLVVYDVTGRIVRELWSGAAEGMPSSVDWNGRDSGGARVADGRYLVRLRINGEAAAAEWVTLLR